MSACSGDGISCNVIQVPSGNDKCLSLELYIAPEDRISRNCCGCASNFGKRLIIHQ